MMNDKHDPLRDVIAAHLQSIQDDRGDGEFAHVSDTYGCDRETWHRRQGEIVRAQRAPEMLFKFAIGHEVERLVCDALQADYEAKGCGVYRDYLIAWNPHDGRGVWNVGLGLSPTREPDATKELLGHADFLSWRDGKPDVLIEVKSTSFLKGRVPTEPQLHYVEQAATYAIAVGATQAGIIIVCRESGRLAGPFWLDLDALEFATIERAKAVLEKTGGMIPPPAVPRYAWQPRYCSMGNACACLASEAAKNDPDPELLQKMEESYAARHG